MDATRNGSEVVHLGTQAGRPFVPAAEDDEAALLGTVIEVADGGNQDAAKAYLEQLEVRLFNSELNRRVLDGLFVAATLEGGLCTVNLEKALKTSNASKSLRDYAIKLPEKVISSGNWTAHLEDVQVAAEKRGLLEDLDHLRERVANDELTRETVADALRGASESIWRSGKASALIRSYSPGDILALPNRDDLILVGDSHVVRGDMMVIGGHPGVGKSRALTELAVCGATGHPWLGYPVHRRFKTFILQNENGARRLRKDFESRDTKELDDWIRITDAPDCGLAFGRDDFRAELRRMVADFQPDVFAIDPFSNATEGDRKDEYGKAFASILDCLPKGNLAPAIAVIAHTRKPQGDERKSGRALLHLLAGSYVLSSRPRCALILQSASDDTEDRGVVLTCAKNNDGEMGPRSAWLSEDGVFRSIADFDWEAFDGRDGGGRPAKVDWPDIEAVLKGNAMTQARLIDALAEHCKCSESAGRRGVKAFLERLDSDANGLLCLK